MELLSNTKTIDISVPLNSGVSAETEEVRCQLPSGGVLKYVIRKRFVDSIGNPCKEGAPLYRTQSGESLPGESVFQCRGCHFFFSLVEGREIMDPPPEVVQLPASPDDSPDADANMVALRVPQENRPRSAFCPECWKREKRTRLVRGIIGFFIGPFISMMTKPQVPVDSGRDLPRPVVLLPGQQQSRSQGSRGRNSNLNRRVNP